MRWRWLILGLLLVGCEKVEIPSTAVIRGEFVVEVSTRGELAAVESRTVARTREGWSQAAIVKLVPEGERVEEGDFLVSFDASDAERSLTEMVAVLDNARASLAATRAQSASRMAELESQLQTQLLNHEQAKLRLSQMQYEADARRKEQELEMRKAELSLEEARSRIESQRTVDAATLRKSEIEVEQAQANVDRAQKVLDAQTLTAPIAGLVVYKTIWKMGSRGKIAVGDQPWPGQEILEIPDLEQMMVRSKVDEVEVHRIALDQPVTVQIDALEGLKLRGHVSRIATLAARERGATKKTFDVEIVLDDTDERLRPGMTVGCLIETERHDDVLSIPLEAVFDRDGQPVVWVEGRARESTAVQLGARNADHVVVEEGLAEGDRVLLRDPTVEVETIGEDASEESSSVTP